VLALAARVEVAQDPALSERFPRERVARLRLDTTDGCTYESGEVTARWDALEAPSDVELREKFRWLAGSLLTEEHAAALEAAAWGCAELPEAGRLEELLGSPR
jgi:hypothetical protein